MGVIIMGIVATLKVHILQLQKHHHELLQCLDSLRCSALSKQYKLQSGLMRLFDQIVRKRLPMHMPLKHVWSSPQSCAFRLRFHAKIPIVYRLSTSNHGTVCNTSRSNTHHSLCNTIPRLSLCKTELCTVSTPCNVCSECLLGEKGEVAIGLQRATWREACQICLKFLQCMLSIMPITFC